MKDRSNLNLWKKNSQTLEAILPQATIIALITFLLPSLGAEFYLASSSDSPMESILGFAENNKDQKDFIGLVLIAYSYAKTLILTFLSTWMVYALGYFALLYTAVSFLRGKPLPSVKEALTGGAKMLFSRSIFAILSFIVLFVLVQATAAPAILFLLPGVMIPVLIANNQSGFLSPLADALKLNYGGTFPGGKWGLFFQLMSIGAFFYAAVLFSGFLCEQLMVADEWLGLSNRIWLMPIDDGPISLVYALSTVIRTLLVSGASIFLATTTATLYSLILSLDSPLPEGGIEA